MASAGRQLADWTVRVGPNRLASYRPAPDTYLLARSVKQSKIHPVPWLGAAEQTFVDDGGKCGSCAGHELGVVAFKGVGTVAIEGFFAKVAQASGPGLGAPRSDS